MADIRHIAGKLAANGGPVEPDKPKSKFFLADPELWEELGQLLERANTMYNGLSGAVARHEITGLECNELAVKLPALIKRLKIQRAKLLRRRKQDSPLASANRVFGADGITRNAAAVAMNKRLSNHPSRRA